MLGQMQVLLFLLLVGMVGCIAHTSKLAHVKSLNRGKEVDNYLQTELSSCTIAQHTVLGFLKTRGVVLGSDSYSSGKVIKKLGNDEQRITVGTAERKVECRISLGPAPVGSKCVAPCGCTGSQKWVQFSELNRLRRKDPSQWSTCRTCQQKFEYNSFTKYGGLKANLIGYLLDNRAIIRSLLGLMFVYLVYTASLPLLLSRALTAQVTWQQYPQWSKLTKLPLPLKLWAVKLAGQDVSARFARWERDVLVHHLADLETQLVEDALPVPTGDLHTNSS